MKAILFRKHGGPEVLEYTDAHTPAIRANEVLVRVRACALNHLDLWVRGGLPGVPIPLPHIPGSDIAGEIAEIGADVTTVKVGQKVVLAPGVSCGKCAACHRSRSKDGPSGCPRTGSTMARARCGRTDCGNDPI